ncbi:MAG: malto-oligosyltrehalose synthase [Gemmataceae bacterium]|nr:malto-oligosyltrehalose synthase [Gemmataceae bacterium]
MSERYVCVHGHFYQPPRENPWLEMVELQDTSYPYHDWNERIAAECYAPNAVARILGTGAQIARLVNNYARISFNFGPTLLAWMQDKEPGLYERVLDADRDSCDRFSGHGSAMAQVFNHQIMPLADAADKRTQVVWGLRDFRHRFLRDPEGMWLAETAVDLATLEVLAAHGIKFTVLAPNQAARVRPVGGKDWQDVSGNRIDPSVAYVQRLPSGRSIALFFYDGPVSRAVAFEQLLTKGEVLAGRLLGAFSDSRRGPQLSHIATDGESYGHHHPHGDMALAYALDQIAAHPGVRLTNYGEFLERHPPAWEVEVFENSSWSCVHGIERWKTHCGCNSGRPGWHQNWRGPLRAALDGLRDGLLPAFEKLGGKLFTDPWAARDDYVGVLLDRRPETQDAFLARHEKKPLAPAERVAALKLMEIQRNLQLMYTSCGWFFDEISGIETVQVMMYAARAIQLAEELFGGSPEAAFLARLAHAPSNLPAEHPTGKDVYERYVKPARVGWKNMAAHYAVAALFQPPGESFREFGYAIDRKDARTLEAGRVKLAVGHATLVSEVTREEADFAYAALHLGDHNATAGVVEYPGDTAFANRAAGVVEAFQRADILQVIRLIDRNFGEATHSVASLFRDLRRAVLRQIRQAGIVDVRELFRRVYEQNLPLMRFHRHLSIPLPPLLRATVEALFDTDLRSVLQLRHGSIVEARFDSQKVAEIRGLVAGARELGVELDGTLGHKFTHVLTRLAEEWRVEPTRLDLLQLLSEALDLARQKPLESNVWAPQNVFFDVATSVFTARARLARTGDRPAREWAAAFIALGEKLGIEVDGLKKQLV